jgi:hypothetical protein
VLASLSRLFGPAWRARGPEGLRVSPGGSPNGLRPASPRVPAEGWTR